MRVVVPFAARSPKTRLAPVLGDDERREFARARLDDVLAAVRDAGETPEVLATAPLDVDAAVTVDDRPLTPAVDAVIDESTPVAVVMADLALATGESLRRLLAADGEVVAAPGRGGGTNALVVRNGDFHVDYHGASIRDHRRIAREVGAELVEVDSMRLATDVDESSDLVEVLLHGDGEAATWLREAGFALDADGGRVGLRRRD